MRIARLPRVLAAAALPLLAAGCLRDPNADANTAEVITALGDEVNALRQENGDLQTQLDSLRGVVARQDTVLRQLAAMAGVPVR